jgi:hypothetical protein
MIEFSGISEIFAKGFVPLLNTNKIQLDFSPKIYISKSREILESRQKGKLFNLKLSSTLPSFSIFGHQGVCVLGV